MIPYAGTITGQAPNANSAAQNVRDLTEHIRGSGKNVTMDRHYSIVELADEPANDRKLTTVGTVQSNRRHIQTLALTQEMRLALSTLLACVLHLNLTLILRFYFYARSLRLAVKKPQED